MPPPNPLDVPEAWPVHARDAAASGAVLVDCRGPHEWEAGHAREAVHIPMPEIPRSLRQLRDHRVFVVCYSGQRSAQVARWLRYNGVEATNVRGGMRAWVDQGLPIVGTLQH
jgi:rhodanese-related sulfurtransferase